MGLLKNFLKIFKGKVANGQHESAVSGLGLLIFEHTSEVIKAESLLKAAGVNVCVKGPPPEVRTGCDLAIEFPIISELKVSRVLKEAKLEPLQILPLYDLLLEPVNLFNVKDFGDYLMVRAANMKITVEKSERRIVNISGGGCPDVPFLAERLIGKTLTQAPEPRTLGSTLCGYALQLAYEELRRRCPG
jgi:hypothetical protein